MERPAIRVLVRADGGAARETGMGHVLKCLWLLDALARHVNPRAVFVMRPDPYAIDVVRRQGHDVRTLPEGLAVDAEWRRTYEIACDENPDLVVVDVLATDAADVAPLRDLGALLLHFDDGGSGAAEADIVVNAIAGGRPAAARGVVLEGLAYERMGPDIARERQRRSRITDELRAIVVTLGGCDYFGDMPVYVSALARAGACSVTALVGPAFTNLEAIEAAAAEWAPRVNVLVSPPDVTAVLARADLAVSAGGSTLFQLAAVGTPMLAMAQYPHQRANIARVVAAGACVNLGAREDLHPDRLVAAALALVTDPARRRAMREAGSRLVDGDGTERVAQLIVGRLAEVACRS